MTATPIIRLQKIVDFLNEVHRLDEDVLPALIGHRVPCNWQVALHPTIVCDRPPVGLVTVGLLGILNGLLGQCGESIAACHDETTGKLIEFKLRGVPPG